MNQDHVFYSALDPAEGSRRYILPGLDGLRALAVFAVLIYHLWPGFLPGGMVGVDVFFVISGYLITALLLREGAYTGKMNIISFWIRRARRLFPAIVVLVAVVGSLAFLVGGDVQVGLGRQVLGAFTFSSNWLYIASNNDYFAQTSPELLTNFWSLAVEEQFYIFWPVALVLLFMALSSWSRRVLVPAILGIFSLGLATVLTLTGTSPSRIYYGTDSHLFGLMLGILLALLIPWSMYPPADRRLYAVVGYGEGWAGRARTLTGWCSLAGIIALYFMLNDRSPFFMPWGLFAGSILAAGVIQALLADVNTLGSRLLGKVLSFPVLVWVGKRSYGIYLWHWPLSVLAHYTFGSHTGHAVKILVLFTTLLIAGLSYMYIEEPIRRLGFRGALANWFTAIRSTKPSAIITTISFILAMGATGLAITTAPQLTEAEAVVAAGASSAASSPAEPQHSVQTADETPASKSTGRSDPPDVLIVGDSVTVAATGSLQQQLPDSTVDAEVSRSLSQVLPELKQKAVEGKLGSILVISLATNSTMSAHIIDETVSELSSHGIHKIIFVTGAAPSDLTWVAQSNDLLKEAAQKYPDIVSIADWAAAAAGHDDYLVSDGVHPTETGQQVYAQTIARAVAAQQEKTSSPYSSSNTAEPPVPATSPAW